MGVSSFLCVGAMGLFSTRDETRCGTKGFCEWHSTKRLGGRNRKPRVVSKRRCNMQVPSMRRPIRVKSFSLSLRGFFLFPLSQAALSPPFHPHSWLSDFRSVPVGCSRFIRCCHLVSGLCFPLYEGSWARHLSQSPKLGGRARLFGTNSLRNYFLCSCTHRLLSIAQRFVHFSTDPQPM